MLTASKSYAHGLQELCSTTFQDMLFMLSSRSRYPAVVVLGSRQACSQGVVRQFRARCQAELLHLDRSFGRADLPSPLLLICSAKLQTIIIGCNLKSKKIIVFPKIRGKNMTARPQSIAFGNVRTTATGTRHGRCAHGAIYK